MRLFLRLPPVHLLGFSDGAIAAYHVAATRRDIVRRLIAVGRPLGLRGYSSAGSAELDVAVARAFAAIKR